MRRNGKREPPQSVSLRPDAASPLPALSRPGAPGHRRPKERKATRAEKGVFNTTYREVLMSLSKLFFVVCALVLGLSGRAYAQATDDFKGFYVGATVGGASIHSNPSTTTVFSPTGYFSSSSPPAINLIGQ